MSRESIDMFPTTILQSAVHTACYKQSTTNHDMPQTWNNDSMHTNRTTCLTSFTLASEMFQQLLQLLSSRDSFTVAGSC